MKLILEKFRRYQRFVEASYEGNLGMEEVRRFYMDAPPEKVTEFEQAVDADENDTPAILQPKQSSTSRFGCTSRCFITMKYNSRTLPQ